MLLCSTPPYPPHKAITFSFVSKNCKTEPTINNTKRTNSVLPINGSLLSFARGCPIEMRVNVSLTVGSHDRKKLNDRQKFQHTGFNFQNEKYRILNTANKKTGNSLLYYYSNPDYIYSSAFFYEKGIDNFGFIKQVGAILRN